MYLVLSIATGVTRQLNFLYMDVCRRYVSRGIWVLILLIAQFNESETGTLKYCSRVECD